MLLRLLLTTLTYLISTPYVYTQASTAPKVEHPRIGNFALPISQQPGALYGFGQNVIDKGDLLLVTNNIFEIAQRNNNFSTFAPSLIYGITDDLVFLGLFPVAMRFNEPCSSSSGLQDALMQLEYLPYLYETEETSLAVSLVGSILLPFGSIHKTPTTGFGSPTFFAGITATYLAIEWYWFFSPGAFFTTSYHNNKSGNIFIYQAGFGKNVGYESDKWLCMLLLELSGIYAQKDKVCGVLNPNSGWSNIGIGPTVWFSTERFFFQGGILPIVWQQVNGNQAKDILFVTLNFAWKF